MAELTVAQRGNELREGRQHTSFEAVFLREGLFLGKADEGEYDADNKEYDEDASPVGPFEHDASQDRRAYRRYSVDGRHE